MDTTTRRGIQHPSLDRSDRPDAPLHLGYLASALDVDVIYNQGTDAARLTAAHVPSGGRFWWATDTNVMWYDDGVTWRTVGSVAAGSITTTQLASSVQIVPLGSVVEWPWASGSIPAWSVLPYGQLLTAASYPDMQTLADASSRPYGGSAGVNFNTPDYRGRASSGKDDMGGVAAGRITAAISGIDGTVLGAVGGAQGITLTTGQMPAHNHGGSTGNDTPDHTHQYAWNAGNADGANGGRPASYPGTNNPATSGASNRHTHPISSEGGGGAHPNVQPTIIVNKIMRVL